MGGGAQLRRPLQSAVWELMLVLTRTETEGQERVLETNLRELMICSEWRWSERERKAWRGDAGQPLDV